MTQIVILWLIFFVAARDEIVSYLNSELETSSFIDSSLNGLQVEGVEVISKIATAVDASLTTITAAISQSAQMLIVHHGVLWEKPFLLTGASKKLFSSIFSAGLNLYASHLPLDAHQTLGNNFTLAKLLDLEMVEPFLLYRNRFIGAQGTNAHALTLNDIKHRLAQLPGANSSMLTLPFGPEMPRKIAIVSGSGTEGLFSMKEHNIDTLITGEPKQFAYHFAKDHMLNVIFAGHYSTETVGVKELGKRLSSRYSVEWTFIDCPTGI